MQLNEEFSIEIRPIPGRNGIKKFSPNLEYYSQAHTIGPFVNPMTLKYRSGLTDKDKKYLEDKGFPYNINEQYIKGVPHEFWESQLVKIGLENGPMFLYPGKNLIHFIQWKYLLVNEFIYKSEEEMLTGSKPQATHYIYNESVENEIKATKLEKKNSLLIKVSSLSMARKKELILILLDEVVDNKKDNYITVKLNEILEDKNASQELEMLLNEDKEVLSLKAEIKKAIQANVLKKTKKGIYYFETNLGFTEEDVVEFFNASENQELYLNIKSKL